MRQLVRKSVGAGARLRLAVRLGLAVAAALVLASPVGRAEGRWRPLDLHAVLVNGAVVGSAFELRDGLAVTNRHVVRGLAPGAPVLLLASRGGEAEGRLLAVSPRMDLALVAVPPGFLPPVAEDAPAAAGLAVTAAGIDAGRRGSGERRSVTGVVLQPQTEIAAFGPGLVAFLPEARPGFSGGPLLDAAGRLVGMVTALRPAAGRTLLASGAGGEMEAFALGAAEVRAEAQRLLAAGG